MSDGIRISTNNFKYAPWYLRILSLLIDKVMITLLVLLIFPSTFKVFSLLGGAHWDQLPAFLTGMEGIWLLVILPLYFVVMWGVFSRTVGMMIMKIRLADMNGKKIGWIKSVLRVFGFYLSVLLLGLGFLPVIFDRRGQGIHDKLTHTQVILKR
jgi:uncharacterized RDD family membrane protein YckC